MPSNKIAFCIESNLKCFFVTEKWALLVMGRKVRTCFGVLVVQTFLSLGYHSFELHTFDHPRHCDACHKLLHGCYFQGYFCPCKLHMNQFEGSLNTYCPFSACNRACHRDCLKDVEICSAVQPQCKCVAVFQLNCTSSTLYCYSTSNS